MFENYWWKHKDKYKGAFILLCIQVFVSTLGFFLIKTFYLQITVEDGIIEKHSSAIYDNKINIKLPKQTFTKVINDKNKISYKGIFGEIEILKKTMSGTIFKHKTMILQKININEIKLRNFFYAQQLYNINKIDPYVFNFIVNQTGDYTSILSDLFFLGDKLNKNIISKPNKKDIQNKIIMLNDYLQKEQFVKAIKFLKKQDDYFQNLIRNKKNETDLTLTTNFTLTKQFKYLYNKLNYDYNNFYKDNIDIASKTFDIEPELIKSAILTEQLRGFFTYRGLVKNIMGGQTYMMVMRQSSRGIGGIKEKTAKKIEQYISKNYPNLYKKRFELMSLNKKEERFQRLTNVHDYFYQIMYVAGNLKMNIDLRKKSGIDISNKPGVILTLYNIGSKTPHPNPEIGGASLNINGTRYSFGTLGMFLYYYMKIYG